MSRLSDPADRIQSWLDAEGLTQKWLADETGWTPKHINRVIGGWVPISVELALDIELATRNSFEVAPIKAAELLHAQVDIQLARATGKQR